MNHESLQAMKNFLFPYNVKFVLNIQESIFDDVLNTNLKGTFLVNQASAKSMIDSNLKDGSIINLSSVSGNKT